MPRRAQEKKSARSFVLNSQFKVIQKIGKGSFSVVYLAHDLNNNGEPVAIKTESMNAAFSQLVKEIQIYSLLDGEGFPTMIKKGVSADQGFIYIATNLLGPSLEDLANLCGRKFSLKTSLMIFYQMLERLEFMHSRNLIHRDIKPDNIMMGLGDDSHVVTMIDFGLCRSIIDPKTNR